MHETHRVPILQRAVVSTLLMQKTSLVLASLLGLCGPEEKHLAGN